MYPLRTYAQLALAEVGMSGAAGVSAAGCMVGDVLAGGAALYAGLYRTGGGARL